MSTKSYDLSNLDAAENIFFARELEFVKAKTYDVMYPDLKAEQFIPMSSEVPEGAESWTYTQYDHVGSAKLIASYADDLPRSDVKGRQFSQTIKSIGSSYGYNRQELRAAQMAGKPLDAKRARSAKDSDARKRDSLACSGDEAAGLIGFFNNPNVDEITASNKTGGGTTWMGTGALGTEMLADLNAIYAQTIENTLGIEVIDTILMPMAQWVKGNDVLVYPNVSSLSVIAHFEKTHPGVKVEPWTKLLDAASDASDLAIGYRRSPDKVVMEVPMPFRQYEPQARNLEYVIACESRFGGVVFFYPLSAVYMKGF